MKPLHKWLIWGVAGAVIVATLGLVGYRAMQQVGDEAALQVGHCLVHGEGTTDLTYHRIDCNDASQYSYLVTEFNKGTTCVDDQAAPLTVTTKGRFGTLLETTSCLIPNFQVDGCYSTVEEGRHEYRLSDCAAAEFRVTQRADAASITCEDPAVAYEFQKAGRSYCLVPAG